MEEITVVLCIFVVIGLVIGGLFTIAIVPAGHIGVMDTFGSVSKDVLVPGFHFKLPWTAVISMSVKTQEIKEVTETPSNEGLIVGLETSFWYRLNPNTVPELYKKVGTDYREVIIEPLVRSAIRSATATQTVKALYTSERTAIAKKISNELETAMNQRGIILEKVMLRDVVLPEKISQAIEAKLTAEQAIQQKVFEVQKEEKEAERKVAEAKGIAESQEIIANSLSQEYLTWYWIDNLSSHQSVYYVPIGSNALPILTKNVDIVEGV